MLDTESATFRLYCAIAANGKADSHQVVDNAKDELAEARIKTLLQDTFGLGEGGRHIVMRWVKAMATGDVGLARVCAWFLHLINGRSRAPPMVRWQAGCPDLVPGLKAQAFWGNELREQGAYFKTCFCEAFGDCLSCACMHAAMLA
jgi:hypothetical protein